MTEKSLVATNGRYFGYWLEPQLLQQIESLMLRVDEGGDISTLNKQAAAMLIQVVDAGFSAYYQQPADLADVSPGLKKTSDVAMNTVQKSIHMVVRSVFKQRSLDDLRKLSGDLAALICVSNTTQRDAYLCFPLEEALYQRVCALIQRTRSDSNIDAYRSEIMETIEALVAAGIEYYYARPVEDANLGRLTRKAADMGIGAVRKGTSAVIRKVFSKISHASVVPLVDYLETLVHPELIPLDQVDSVAEGSSLSQLVPEPES